MKNTLEKLRVQTRIYIWAIIIGLAISGLTAFPLETELAYLVKHSENFPNDLQFWLLKVYQSVKNTNQHYPFLSYGTDWLAFAHLMLAILFIGPLRDPVRSKWIIEFGVICCISIVPLALIAGKIRQIPLFWQLIDSSFGIMGAIPLVLALINVKKLNALEADYGFCR